MTAGTRCVTQMAANPSLPDDWGSNTVHRASYLLLASPILRGHWAGQLRVGQAEGMAAGLYL